MPSGSMYVAVSLCVTQLKTCMSSDTLFFFPDGEHGHHDHDQYDDDHGHDDDHEGGGG